MKLFRFESMTRILTVVLVLGALMGWSSIAGARNDYFMHNGGYHGEGDPEDFYDVVSGGGGGAWEGFLPPDAEGIGFPLPVFNVNLIGFNPEGGPAFQIVPVYSKIDNQQVQEVFDKLELEK